IFNDDFDPLKEVVLEGNGEVINRNWGSDGQITLLAQANPNIIQIVVSTPTDSILVLSDLWFPGWSAYLDGIEIEIYRANYLLRALPIPPGSHTVEFKYRPLSFTIGASLTTITLISMGFVLWKTRRS
ncbi:MAG: YfhO family protein, partial [Candidatus Heimdallarchaeota archaeon]